MDPTGVVMGAAGLVMAGLAVWLVTRSASRGAIEVNAAIGIRTRLTGSSQLAWEAGHLAALPLASAACALAVIGATASVAAIVLADAFGTSGAAAVVIVVAGYVGFLVTVILAARAANRAVRELPPESSAD